MKVSIFNASLTIVLYQACIHPEQYSNTLPKSALKTLHEKIHSVTTVAAAVLGDSSKFPDDWLFSYRWGKSRTRGKKGGKGENNVLPNGEKIIHITVGGRTSAVVESRQKKIKGNGDISDEERPASKKMKGVKEDKENMTSNKSVKGKESPASKKAGKLVKEGESTPETKRVSRKAEEFDEEEMTPKKRRVSEKQANGAYKSTPTRKSSRSKA